MKSLVTARLALRRWNEADIEPFAALNADKMVMEFFTETLDRQQTTIMVQSIENQFKVKGFGLWAVEILHTQEFIGFVGLCQPKFEAAFTPCVEVGWRLGKQHWGNGYALEAAKEAIRDGFERLDLPEIVSFTAAINKRSIKVMERLKMKRDAKDDFLHPSVAEGHILKPHVLYRLSKGDWLASY